MSIYSGFATRQTQRKYNKLVGKLILTLESTIQDILAQTKYTIPSHIISQYTQITAKLKAYEQHKYLEPKFSNYTEKFMISLLSTNQPFPLQNQSQQNLDQSLKNVNINTFNKKQNKMPTQMYLYQQNINDYHQTQSKTQYSLQNQSDFAKRVEKGSLSSKPKSISNSLHSKYYFTSKHKTQKHIQNQLNRSQKELFSKQGMLSKQGIAIRIKTQQNQKQQSKASGKSQQFRINNKIVRSPQTNVQSSEFINKPYGNRNKFMRKEKIAVDISQSIGIRSNDASKKMHESIDKWAQSKDKNNGQITEIF